MPYLQKSFTIGVLVVSLLGPASCARSHMKPHYARASMQPVTVEKRSDGDLVIGYAVPLESIYYSSGIN